LVKPSKEGVPYGEKKGSNGKIYMDEWWEENRHPREKWGLAPGESRKRHWGKKETHPITDKKAFGLVFPGVFGPKKKKGNGRKGKKN